MPRPDPRPAADLPGAAVAPPFQLVLHAATIRSSDGPEYRAGADRHDSDVFHPIITTLSITREREAGTMENLLAMPVRPLEVMLGKIIPYVGLGYVQVLLILAIAVAVFGRAGARVGLRCCWRSGSSSPAIWRSGSPSPPSPRPRCRRNNWLSSRLLPSIMLSGFMYPFQGMPAWARAIGEVLPLTHAMRICRGILLKGNGLQEIARISGPWRCSLYWPA